MPIMGHVDVTQLPPGGGGFGIILNDLSGRLDRLQNPRFRDQFQVIRCRNPVRDALFIVAPVNKEEEA